MRKSEFARDPADFFSQFRSIDLSTDGVHPNILRRPSSARRETIWHSEDDTRAFAQRLARQPALADAFLTLHGDLGAGKTTLVRHLLRALGVPGRIVSPTFAVVEPYRVAWPQRFAEKTGVETAGSQAALPAALSIWHFDFYRFADPREWEDAGFRDIFASRGLKLAEWPEHAGAALPTPDLAVRITTRIDEARDVSLAAYSACGQELLNT